MRVGILTVSDAGARGERVDTSGDTLAAWAEERGYDVAARTLVADDTHRIVPVLLEWCDVLEVELLITTGGTGLAPRDVTPEATRSVLEREAPGIAEEIRRRGLEKTGNAILSRGLAGVRGGTLVVNLPGSTGGVRDGIAVLEPLVEHAVALIRDRRTSHGPKHAGGGVT